MKKHTIISLLVLCLCPCFARAQHMFDDVYNFKYEIYYDSDYGINLSDSIEAFFSVTYRAKEKSPNYVYRVGQEMKREGRVLDTKVRNGENVYMLENFYEDKTNAYISITRSAELDNLLVAIIYPVGKEKRLYKELILLDGMTFRRE